MSVSALPGAWDVLPGTQAGAVPQTGPARRAFDIPTRAWDDTCAVTARDMQNTDLYTRVSATAFARGRAPAGTRVPQLAPAPRRAPRAPAGTRRRRARAAARRRPPQPQGGRAVVLPLRVLYYGIHQNVAPLQRDWLRGATP
jgi:hypothetical protein